MGHGCGDSLLLHLGHPAVPRPARLVGITSRRLHYRRALERTTTHPNADLVDVRLYEGAVCRRNVQSPHPLGKECLNSYTSVLALDCAYHFDTRRAFLEQAFACLVPGGRIALTDLCFTHGLLTFRTKMRAFGTMPWNNIITNEEYVATLRTIGYTDVVLEDISEHVFPGLIQFLNTRNRPFRTFASHLDGIVSCGMRFVIVSASKPVSNSC